MSQEDQENSYDVQRAGGSQSTVKIFRQGQQPQEVLNQLGVLNVPVSLRSVRSRKESWSSKVKKSQEDHER